MKICVYHPRFARGIGAAVASAFPDCEVGTSADLTQDPPLAAQVEVLIANRFPVGLLGRMPQLRWLQLTGVGTDHVAAGAPRAALQVTHAGDIPAIAVAEFVWMALLGLAKDAPRLVLQQRDHVWQLPRARRLYGTTLVLLGLGRIGSEVARRAAAFGMRVIAVRQSGAASQLAHQVVTAHELPAVLPLADHVVVALPATPSTHHLLSPELVALIPSEAVLISVGRPNVIALDAVLAALRAQRLRAALLDVHDYEPLLPSDPLWQQERLWITPHCAYEYPEQEADLIRLIVENVARFRRGLPLLNSAAW